MEHWQSVLLGVVLGCPLVALFYFLVFDPLLRRFRSTSPSLRSAPVPMLGRLGTQRRGQSMSEQEAERLIYEDFKTEGHEVLVTTVHDKQVCVGICAFLNDLKVEYFVERFDRCCVDRCNDLALRSLLGAVATWGDRWMGAEVSLLCQERDLVVRANEAASRERRLLAQLEERFEFGVAGGGVQWNENFMCHDVDFEELWEGLVVQAKLLLASAKLFLQDENVVHKEVNNTGLSHEEVDSSVEDIWRRFPLKHWDRTRVRLSRDRMHMVPHAGQIIEEEDDSELLLVDI